eukprot:CAMPEP_0168166678 /NCGR_PEP_ID=MMETSP0139_2-20121125/2156_1 /TAXON_ID=44445 /ORGANISM="Pseudo-nitzschia australis, Strain 10249 10 AB" /LENGTH=361 /DNA_ID=CAMNT_0008083893 /DNA_START=79 /DNA_END=1161 /DNA_ORIENTATION=+
MKTVQSNRDISGNGNSGIVWFFVRWVTPLINALFLFNSVVPCDCLVQKQPISPSPAQLFLPASKEELYPPLVLLGGIAQTKSSWDHHLGSLAKHRKVLVYECLGQGDNTMDENDNTNLDASLPAQAQRLLEQLDEILVAAHGENDNPPVVDVDVAGFSFGGRVAMATACLQMTACRGDSDGCLGARTRARVRIRRLHLTGVGCDRSDYGHLAMRSFLDVIRNDPSLRSFAWSILLATYSSSYLRSLPETTLERFLVHIASSNNPNGLLAILDQAEVSDPTDPWHVVNMADRLFSAGLSPEDSSELNNYKSIVGKLCVGEFDKMAPVEEVVLLQKKLGWVPHQVDILPDCGHAVVLEKPRAW